MAYNFTAIEKKWQKYWLENKTFAALDPTAAPGMPKAYILDMFPYPSGAGLHVGHPEGYTATDIVSRYKRMQGFNVLHPMGWDAFGLPAEQYAVKTNTHPRITTEQNIANFRRQIQMLGLSYDWDREVDTTDPNYYRWTQWIFLRLFNSYFDPATDSAKPITHLLDAMLNENLVVGPDNSIHINPTQDGLAAVAGEMRIERLWHELNEDEQREVIDGQRLAYMDEVAVNWCPGLGTVLANEEVVDGRSEVGGFPVERRPMRQWMLRITAYADRLLADLDTLAWPESLKDMQRNWIGKSVGAEVDFEIIAPAEALQGVQTPEEKADDEAEGLSVTVFTTRPDTLYGATYMVLAPEHELVDRITPPSRRETIEAYRTMVAGKSDRDRTADVKQKTGVFIGAHAVNPVNGEQIPVYIADYVLANYGTGAIMAVPAHDDRDYAFAKQYDIAIKTVVAPIDSKAAEGQAFTGIGSAVNSPIIDGLLTADAKSRMLDWLEDEGVGKRSTNYKLRDWLFSRQRYWGEPFPIVLDADGNAVAISETELPLTLPEMADFKPSGTPEPPLSKAKDWIAYSKGAETYTRETNTMPQWAGSCWYYLRYIDPKNSTCFVDPEKEKYWMPVDLYVGGAEHAVLHLLYSRFWHKVLFDLGHVSTTEPFNRLVNQGIILGEMEFETAEPAPRKVDAGDVEKIGTGYRLKADPSIKVEGQTFKMSKARGNVVSPDDVVKDYGADAFRLYEMYMGPLEAQKPWNTRDIIGMVRFLNGVWRNLIGDEVVEATSSAAPPVIVSTTTTTRVKQEPVPEILARQMHRTIKKVAEDIESLRFNTAIAELIKLNNELTGLPSIPREVAENLTLMLAPFAPHAAEELWERLGHHKSLARRPWPTYDPAMLIDSTIDLPVQVNGKLRDKITVAADASESQIFEAAVRAEKVIPWVEGKELVKKLYVPKKLVNFVVK